MSVSEYLARPDLARFPFLFIVTYGRSGSTLLQGILNSIPGYTIRGENYATLFHLFSACQAVGEAHRGFGQRETTPKAAWFGADLLDPEAFCRSQADLFLDTCLQPLPGTRCIGFKEIRHLDSQIPDETFPAYLNFLQQAFPGAGVVFNMRNVDDTARSGWWKRFDSASVKQRLLRANKRFEDYADGQTDCFIFSYDSLRADASYCASLFNFLGEPFDQEAVEAVLQTPHGYQMQADNIEIDAEQEGSHEELLVATLRQAVKSRSERTKELNALIGELRARLKERAEEFGHVQGRLLSARNEATRLRARVDAIERSASWRLATPIRALSRLITRVASLIFGVSGTEK